MKRYLGLENYDGILPTQIEALNTDGVIVGDPFCQYRMFKYGDADLVDFTRTVCQSGKEIIYQTPVYVTDRNLMNTTKMIENLYNKYNVKKFLVQDVGLADWIIKRFSDVDVIWGHWGRNRNSLMNHDFIEFLLQLGVAGIETNLPERITKIPEAGLSVYVVYGNIVYNTLSRDCYNTYMLNRFDGLCERECLSGEMSLYKNSFQMTVDGHILGRKIQYPGDDGFLDIAKHNSDHIMIYATDYYESKKILEILN